MNIHEVSRLLNVNPETLRKWDKHFNLNINRNKKGHREYTDEDVKKLQTIKQLRDLDNGLSTIQRKINPSYAAKESNKDQGIYIESTVNHHTPTAVSKLDLIKKEVVSMLDTKLDSIIDMSEKLSRASFEIGKLQAEKQGLEDKMKLITDSNNKDYSNLRNEVEKVKTESNEKITDLQEENNKLKSELEKERLRPWYNKLFGR